MTENTAPWGGYKTAARDQRELANAAEILDGSTGKWYFNIEPGSVSIDDERQTVTFTVVWNHTSRRRRITLGLEQVRGYRVDLA